MSTSSIINQSYRSPWVIFPGPLTLLVLALKLTGKITISWFWVFSPLFVSAAISGLILLVFAVLLFLALFLK